MKLLIFLIDFILVRFWGNIEQTFLDLQCFFLSTKVFFCLLEKGMYWKISTFRNFVPTYQLYSTAFVFLELYLFIAARYIGIFLESSELINASTVTIRLTKVRCLIFELMKICLFQVMGFGISEHFSRLVSLWSMKQVSYVSQMKMMICTTCIDVPDFFFREGVKQTP